MTFAPSFSKKSASNFCCTSIPRDALHACADRADLLQVLIRLFAVERNVGQRQRDWAVPLESLPAAPPKQDPGS